jgi:hypothetical protein
MTITRIALVAFTTLIGAGALLGSGHQAAADGLDFLNHMNPKFTNCVNSTRANIAPQYRDQRDVHDGIITACARQYPPLGK